MKKFTFAAIVSTLIIASTMGSAQAGGSPGDIKLKVQTKNALCTAEGTMNSCVINAGKMSKSKVSGKLDVLVNVDEISSTALVFGSKAEVNLGTVENSTLKGNVHTQINVPQVTAVANGTMNKSVIDVGVIRDNKLGGKVRLTVNADKVIASTKGTGNSAHIDLAVID